MVAVGEKPGNIHQPLSKQKQAVRVCKKMVSVKGQETHFSTEWYANRRKIKQLLGRYRELLKNRNKLDQLSQKHGKNPEIRPPSGLMLHMRVARVLQSSGQWINTGKEVGTVSGIKAGDEFRWRGELSIVGLHHEFQRGIAWVRSISGKVIATSIVDSGRYENVVWITSDKLVYSGEGENLNLGGAGFKKAKDQKLAGGNLALKNSMDEKKPVRVIQRVNINENEYKFVYQGLYRVTEYWTEKGEFGASVYKFSLRKY
ncbi:hypothetical protein PTKIN_Ptkin10aG0178200 [Pterospermum kingtungense]